VLTISGIERSKILAPAVLVLPNPLAEDGGVLAVLFQVWRRITEEEKLIGLHVVVVRVKDPLFERDPPCIREVLSVASMPLSAAKSASLLKASPCE